MGTATNQSTAIFRIACDRHQDRLGELCGEDYEGIVTSDGWRAYALLDPEQRQACLAMTGRIFGVWHAFTEQPERRRLQREMKPIEAQRAKLLEHAANGGKRHRLHFRFAKNLLKIWPALWTFVTVYGVAPTNNAAERALRGPVIHGRLSDGNQSDDGGPIHPVIPLCLSHLSPAAPLALPLPPAAPQRPPTRWRAPALI